MKKVLIPTKLDAVARELLLAAGDYAVVQDDGAELAELAAAHADSYALIVRSEKVTPAIIDALPALKVIIRAGAGYDTIDHRYARARKIDVMNTPGANANAVAEEVVALMLADARHVVAADASCRAGEWEKKKFMGREITGKTMGILGLGAIGRLVAKRLAGFDMRLLGCDPVFPDERARELGIEPVNVETLFRQSDYVSLHIPENDETRGLVNASLLDLMKPGATIINCARAGVVNEEDIRRARTEKKLRFLNDVYPKDAAGDKTVRDIADVMLPHLGASTAEANFNAARRAAEQLIEFDGKGVSTYIVNRDIPQGLDEAYCDLAYTLSQICHLVVGRDTRLQTLETSFYGDLEPYGDWLLVPVLAALSKNFDRSSDCAEAGLFLKDMGIEYINRPTDESKPFTNSITIDMVGSVDSDNLRRASVRGTVAEGCLMVSRINDFDKLYFEPSGYAVMFTYEDRPGVLSTISTELAARGINIDDVRNPHDSAQGVRSLAIMKVSQPVSVELVQTIAARIKALAAFTIEF